MKYSFQSEASYAALVPVGTFKTASGIFLKVDVLLPSVGGVVASTFYRF
nr:hypothetical protein [Capnocytophaga canimorsus]